jgi:hypothetical protein
MKLYGVYLGIDNGVEQWAVHALILGGEGFFIESSPALMVEEQAKRVEKLVAASAAFNAVGKFLKIRELLDTGA